MIIVPPTNYIAGIGQTVSVLSCVMFGLEPGGDGAGYSMLYQGQLPAVAGALYTAPDASVGMVREVMVYNTDAANAKTFSLFIGGTDGAHTIYSTTIPAGGSAIYDGQWSVYDATGKYQSSASGGGGSSPLTTRGDLYTRGASADARLAIGAANAILGTDGTDAIWRTIAVALGALVTTRGDVITRDGSSVIRKAVGTANQAMETDGTDVLWRSKKGFEGSCSAEAVSNNADDPIEWTTETTDTDGYHAASANAIVIPAGLGGWYAISASVVFSSGGTQRRLSIKNGATVIAYGVDATVSTQRSATWIGKLAAGDSITVVALANGAGVTVDGQVGLVYLGA